MVAGDTQRDKSPWLSPARLEAQGWASKRAACTIYSPRRLGFQILYDFRARENEGPCEAETDSRSFTAINF